MIEVKTVIIKKYDLKKLMKNKGIKSVYQLAKMSGLPTSAIYPAINKNVVLTQKVWDKLKVCL